MPANYTRLYYHFVWATKGRLPLLTPEIEMRLFSYIRDKGGSLGARIFAMNGMPDHVHLGCTIPTDLSIAVFIEHVKGGSSHFLNHLPDRPGTFYWQRVYGALTLNRADLPRVVAYIDQQKEHHRTGGLLGALERWDEPTHPSSGKPLYGRVREETTYYDADPFDEP